MGAPPSTLPVPAPVAAPTYPKLGGLFVAAGIGLTTFAATVDGALPHVAEAVIAGLGAACGAVGGFLLGHAVGGS